MLSTLLTVWLLHVAALVTPGANVLLVSHLAADGDRRGAMHAAVGVSVGAVVWSSAAVLGVGALFAKAPVLRLSLQGAGAAYLMYVAARLWRVPPPSREGIARFSRYQTFRAGLLTNLSNPKAALFFASIFSSALPSHPRGALLAASIGLVFANALGWHLLLAFLFSRPTVKNGYAVRRAVLTRVAAMIIGAFGFALLVSAIIERRSS
jgi:threonine/homoserine/homoserine lactone efflux protein